jgi:hypothetical protein
MDLLDHTLDAPLRWPVGISTVRDRVCMTAAMLVLRAMRCWCHDLIRSPYAKRAVAAAPHPPSQTREQYDDHDNNTPRRGHLSRRGA